MGDLNWDFVTEENYRKVCAEMDKEWDRLTKTDAVQALFKLMEDVGKANDERRFGDDER